MDSYNKHSNNQLEFINNNGKSQDITATSKFGHVGRKLTENAPFVPRSSRSSTCDWDCEFTSCYCCALLLFWLTQGNGKLSSRLASSVLIDNVENLNNNNNMCECARFIEAFWSSTVDLEKEKKSKWTLVKSKDFRSIE